MRINKLIYLVVILVSVRRPDGREGIKGWVSEY